MHSIYSYTKPRHAYLFTLIYLLPAGLCNIQTNICSSIYIVKKNVFFLYKKDSK